MGDTFNYGLTGGIIAGDLCLSWSEQMFSSIGEGALSGTEARNIFDTMRTEVMAGQYLDVLSEVIPAETPENASLVLTVLFNTNPQSTPVSTHSS